MPESRMPESGSAPANDDGWITTPMAARMLGVQVRTILNMIDRYELPAEAHRIRHRRVIRLRRSEVEAYIERARVKPGELRHLYP